MRKNLLVSCLLITHTLFAQVDKKWVVGYLPSILQFDADTTTNHIIDSNKIIIIAQTTANICAEDGSLLFFSNGMCLFDKYGDTIENAFNFHPPQLSTFYNQMANSSQAALILPKSNGQYYYLYYSMSDYNYTHNKPFDLLCYSTVDMNINNGRGKVTSKNSFLLQGTALAPYGLTACRHANGRDWWLIMPELVKNAYYTFLVTPDTIMPPTYQLVSSGSFGTINPHGQCTFSNNGDYLAATNFDGGVKVMRFDRCNGVINFWIDLTIPYDSFSQYGIGANGVAFSMTDRFLYANTFKKIYQFDLTDSNVQQSILEIGKEDSIQGAMFDPIQIAPNGKIYISNFAGATNTYSVINNPDEKGLLSNYTYHSDTIWNSAAVVGVPNMPHYHLGALVGSGCDTLTGVNEVSYSNDRKVFIYPNPANNAANLFLNLNELEGGDLYLFDLLGNTVLRYTIVPDKTVQTFSLANVSTGTYFYSVQTSNGFKTTGKIVVVN